MRSRHVSHWIWGDALSLLEKVELLHKRFSQSCAGNQPSWEPPVDVVESENEVILYVALPGVSATTLSVVLRPDGVTVSGLRKFPAAQAMRIHRLEIPYGKFERHIPFTLLFLEPTTQEFEDGCLVLRFRKVR
ncbi:Hsp20/alpha crystallin family protein [Crenobacter sp. SG2303]|uniref:Hsp20/alpha crystallin family protein n=1 Tax=Crenobacter oryzisoli TaxID=3056844 RepID=A0ABT7XNM8_9NEIS|nr:Hsp20/alpha crystallin family protein [Crenobacter sp. SG2303]MDN0075406.1 Hsp20/alpha crystallin family protein [Crenobacter sp. SG2303]